MSQLAPKNILRMLRYIGQNGISGHSQKAFNVLRKHDLKPFPPPSVKPLRAPKLVVMGFTGMIANVVPLRGLFMRTTILSHIPPECVGFRECIMKSIPCFKYGDTLDNCFLNATAEARDVQNYHCICANPSMSEYVVRTKDGSDCVLTTNGGCLNNKDAEAVLKLQAGFRSCMDLAIKFVDLLDWKDALFAEIHGCLEYAVDVEDARPLTGNINFTAAKQAFKYAHEDVVITKVDKAANCLSVMSKACYAGVTVAELSGPAYKRIDGESLTEILQQITTRQLDYLRSAYLPIPLISVKDPDPDPRKYTLEQLTNIPVIYIMPKLHRDPGI